MLSTCKHTLKKQKRKGNTKSRRGGNTTKSAIVIAKAVKSRRSNIQSGFLHTKCPDPGSCLALGIERKENTHEITYKRNNYSAFAILKSALFPGLPNLYYEFKVGQFLNRYIDKLPCFTETYGLYIWNSDRDHQKIQLPQKPASILKSLVQLSDDEDLLAESCVNNRRLALLVQHFNNVQTMSQFVKNNCVEEHAFVVELPCMLLPDLFFISLLSRHIYSSRFTP